MILPRNLPLVALLLVAPVACASPEQKAMAKMEKTRDLLNKFLDQKYALLTDTRKKLRADPEMVRTLGFMDRIEDFSSPDLKVKEDRAAEDREIKIWWDAAVDGVKAGAKAGATVKASKAEIAKGQEIFLRSACLRGATARLFHHQTDTERMEEDKWITWRMGRLKSDLGDKPFGLRQIAAYTALREYRNALHAMAQETFGKVENLFGGK